MQDTMSLWLDLMPDHLLKLGVSALCGLLLGLERERRDKPAGLRTIVLISVGSTLFMIAGELMSLATQADPSMARPDPTRIGSQVVTGVGFLGAGTIMQSRGSVHGLTTAATIWVASAAGLCVGAGFYLTALAGCLLVLGTLVLLDPLSDKLRAHGEKRTIRFETPGDTLCRQAVELMLQDHKISREQIDCQEGEEQICWTVASRLRAPGHLQLLWELNALDFVQGLPWQGTETVE